MCPHSNIIDAPFEEPKRPAIYSGSAIAVFTFFFTTIFGGMLAYQNLERVGKKGTGVKVLLACCAWVIISFIIIIQGAIPLIFIFIVKAGVAFVFGHRVNDVYLPGHEKMPKRKIWVPLAVGLGLIALMLGIGLAKDLAKIFA